jgi:tRNA-splicing ligase RtcB
MGTESVDTQITTFGPVDKRAYEQLVRCAQKGDAGFAVLCADHHVGYSQPIGGAIAYERCISPSGVGYDIGCGNKAVRTNLLAADVDISRVMDEIQRRISFGMGRANREPVDHPVLEKIANAEFTPQRALLDRAEEQLGTVGGGNHYVDLFEDENGALWVGVHFGSRGFGHLTASGFLALAQGLQFNERAKEGEMDAPPTLLDVQSALGQEYLEAMHLAGEYAYAGRDVVVDKVLALLGARAEESVHNHHNFAWREEHAGGKWWVVRKGCTPAFPGQRGFVGATMGDVSVILEGVESEASRDALFSTVHGAGRIMSRTQAAGKQRKVVETRRRPDGSEYKWKGFVRSGGLIDWQATQADLRAKGIALRGGGADEAPGAYKRLDEVLAYHGDTIRILHRLRPLGVAMAGEDVYDPYKD